MSWNVVWCDVVKCGVMSCDAVRYDRSLDKPPLPRARARGVVPPYHRAADAANVRPRSPDRTFVNGGRDLDRKFPPRYVPQPIVRPAGVVTRMLLRTPAIANADAREELLRVRGRRAAVRAPRHIAGRLRRAPAGAARVRVRGGGPARAEDADRGGDGARAGGAGAERGARCGAEEDEGRGAAGDAGDAAAAAQKEGEGRARPQPQPQPQPQRLTRRGRESQPQPQPQRGCDVARRRRAGAPAVAERVPRPRGGADADNRGRYGGGRDAPDWRRRARALVRARAAGLRRWGLVPGALEHRGRAGAARVGARHARQRRGGGARRRRQVSGRHTHTAASRASVRERACGADRRRRGRWAGGGRPLPQEQ